MKKKINRIIRTIGWVLCFLGLFSFIGPMFMINGLIDYEGELPLEIPEGVVVSSNGFVFIGLPAYSKIQCYNGGGHFVKNWSINNYGGDFRMKIKNDTIMIATARNSSLIQYDINGQLISNMPDENVYSEFKMFDSNKFIIDGFEYEIKPGLITEVWKRNKEVNEILFRSTGLKLLFRGPIQAIMIFICGLGVLMYTGNSLMEQSKNYRGRFSWK